MTFGKMPLANGFLEKKNFESEFFYEMEVGFSEKISLLQLNESPDPKKIFNKKYPFYSGSSEHMKIHFKKYAEWLKKEFLKTKWRKAKLKEVFSMKGYKDRITLRESIKKYSDWPTIPQLYIKGEFVGGCDIVKEMFENNELQKLLSKKNIQYKIK